MLDYKEKWIIDTDPGCDDMVALLYMFNRKDIDIELISLCEGNTHMDNVLINIRKILKIAERMDLKDKIYKGGMPILKGCPLASFVHQVDGLGDVEDLININIDDIKVPSGMSPLKIIECILNHPHQINLLLIGPLTNFALAYMLCPEISSLVKSIYIMGGTLKSTGNLLPSSEFNFSYDYIAPKIVLKNFRNIVLVPWDTTYPHVIKHEELFTLKFKMTVDDILYNKTTFHYVDKLVHKISFLSGGLIINDFYCAICNFNKNTIDLCCVAEVSYNSDTEMMRGSINITHKKCYSDFYSALESIQNRPGKLIVIQKINFDVIKQELANVFRY